LKAGLQTLARLYPFLSLDTALEDVSELAAQGALTNRYTNQRSDLFARLIAARLTMQLPKVGWNVWQAGALRFGGIWARTALKRLEVKQMRPIGNTRMIPISVKTSNS
jgi:hypothetical protein